MSPASKTIWLLLALPGGAAALPALAPAPGWPVEGATLAVRTFSRGSLRVVDGGGGALIAAWQDGREIGPNSCNCRNKDDIYAQRLRADGRFSWTADGVPVCTWDGMWGGPDQLVGLAPAADGGAVVAWNHGDGPSGTYVRHVLPGGRMEWGRDGATLYERQQGTNWTARAAFGPRDELWLGLDGADDHRFRIGRCRLAAGAPVCASPVEVPLPARRQWIGMVPAAGRAGALVIVSTSRTPDGEVALWALAAAGDPPRPGALVPLTRSRAAWLWVQVAADGAGGAYVAWTGPGPEGGAPRVRLQRVTARGEPAWPVPADAGLEPVAGGVASLAAGPGGAAVAWSVTGPAAPVTALRAFDASGRPDRPAPTLLGAAVNPERSPALAAVAGGWVVCWTEREPGDRESARAAFVPPRRGEPSPPLTLYGTVFCRAEPQVVAAPAPRTAVVFASTSGCVADANVLRAISLRVGDGR